MRCPASIASGSRMSTTMPQPSPGQKPLDARSYTRISPVARAPVLAKPMISKGSMLRSTPPATAASAVPSMRALHAVATDSRDDEQARHPSLVPAHVLERGPERAADERPAQPHQVGPGEFTGQAVADDDRCR